jgi:hypothetical protein
MRCVVFRGDNSLWESFFKALASQNLQCHKAFAAERNVAPHKKCRSSETNLLRTLNVLTLKRI